MPAGLTAGMEGFREFVHGAFPQAPGWLLRLFGPLIARQLAREMSRRHPGLEPPQIVEKMRAELGEAPDPRAHLWEHRAP